MQMISFPVGLDEERETTSEVLHKRKCVMVFSFRKRFGHNKQHAGSARHPMTNALEDRYIMRLDLQNRRAISRTIAYTVRTATITAASLDNVE
ncbi:hypothetical protein TNCV_3580561 [Trichonephila clavipes]|nr:hypothetical protein TNCV_3580561 [Trichonephila clavipes]